jgi:hypothetical protein
MNWTNITNPKDWFESKEQCEFVKWAAELFEAQEVRGLVNDLSEQMEAK